MLMSQHTNNILLIKEMSLISTWHLDLSALNTQPSHVESRSEVGLP